MLFNDLCVGESWFDEFQRLCYHVPTVQTETLTDHMNQVLHVSFSHDGRYFATCSKDGYVLVRQRKSKMAVILECYTFSLSPTENFGGIIPVKIQTDKFNILLVFVYFCLFLKKLIILYYTICFILFLTVGNIG